MHLVTTHADLKKPRPLASSSRKETLSVAINDTSLTSHSCQTSTALALDAASDCLGSTTSNSASPAGAESAGARLATPAPFSWGGEIAVSQSGAGGSPLAAVARSCSIAAASCRSSCGSPLQVRLMPMLDAEPAKAEANLVTGD